MKCCLCGCETDGRFGVRVADHRYVVCYPHAGLPVAEAAMRLAERALATGTKAEPSKRPTCPAVPNKGRWRWGNRPRCSTGCKLASGHRGKCFNGNDE